nr:MAG TPA: nuclease [Caudoviricetes sp.]
MDEERLKRIRANIAKHEERKKTQNIMGDIDSSKLDRSNTSYNKNDAAFEMAKQHYQNSYLPKKAQEYYKGVENYRNSYEQMANKPSANNYTVMTPENESANLIGDGINTYVSPQMREKAQKHYNEVFNNENKKYAEQYARLNEKSKPAYSYAQAKSEAAKKVDNSINAFSSQFKDENEYNAYADNMARAKEQQRLLNYNVAEARNKLLTMKALNMNPSVKVEDTDEYKQIESDMKKAESVQEFAKNMQNEDFRKQYAEYEQHQKDYENKNWFGKAVEQVGDAIAGSIYNTGEGMYTAFIEPVTNAADYFIGRNPYEEGTLSNKIHSFYNYVHDEADRRERFSGYAQQGLTTDLYNATNNEEFSKFTSGVITTTLDAVAEAGLSMAVAALSGGTSLAAKGIQTTVGLTKAQKVAQTASSMLKGLMKDLNFWTSFAREGGSAYNDAIDAGASNEEATIAMLATGLPNAYIEIGGGVEKFKDLAGTGVKGWLRDFAKSTGEEATEELKQGIISELVKKLTYAPETELFSTADDGSGIINPIRMYQEAFGGAVGGAFGGSVGKAINVASYTVANNMYKSDSMRELIQSGKYTEMLKALPDSDFKNSEISKTFSAEMDEKQTLAKLKGISNRQLIKQYDSMVDTLSSVSEGNVASLALIATGDTKTATEVAPILRKLYDGKVITEEEAKIISRNENVVNMLSETTGLDMTNSSWEDFVTLSEQAQFENITGTSTGNAIADVVLGNAQRAEAGRNYIAEEQNKYANDLSGTPTFTAQIGDESVKITEINHVENGEVYVNLSNGTTQEAQSLNTDEVTTALLSYASEYDAKTASAFIGGYTGNISVGEYARSFAGVNSAARTGLSYENIAKTAQTMVNNIGESTAKYLAETGNVVAQEQKVKYDEELKNLQSRQAKRLDKASVKNETNGTATKAHKRLARTISKITGYTVTLVDSTNGYNNKQNGRTAIGSINSTKGEIVLDIGEGNVAATSLHESVHYIRINAPEEFNAMAKYVVEWLTRNGTLEEYLDRYASSYKLDNIYDLTEEMTADVAEALLKNADFVEDLFTDESFVKEICGENRTFAEKFIDALKSIIEAIKNYLKSGDVNHLIAGKLSEDAKALEKFKNLWEDGLKAAVDNHAKISNAKENTDTQSNGGVKYSKAEKNALTKEEYKRATAAFMNGDTSAIIEDCAIRVTNKNDVYKIKIVCYNLSDDEFDFQITEVYQIENYDYNIHSENEDPAVIIAKGVRDGYTQREIEALLQNNKFDDGQIFKRFSPQSGRYYRLKKSTGRGERVSGGKSSGSGLSEETEQSETESKLKFSLSEPVEEKGNLIAVHNIYTDKLVKSLKLGGFPMPSIAVTKADMGHENYGECSFVFDKSTIDPKSDKRNKVYGGDAWTPTYPAIEYKVSEKIADKARRKYYDLYKQYGEKVRDMYRYSVTLEDTLNSDGGEQKMLDKLYDDVSMMQIYRLDHGEDVISNVVKREEKQTLNEQEIALSKQLLSTFGNRIEEIAARNGENPLPIRKAFFNKYHDEVTEAFKKYYRSTGMSIEEAEAKVANTKTFTFVSSLAKALKYKHNKGITVTEDIDYEATDKAIRDSVNQSEYRKWIDGLFKGAEEKSGIWNGKDFYTPSGRTRNFDALHYEETLENVVKVMRSEMNGDTLFGGMGIWGVAQKEYSSIDKLKSDSARLQKMSDDEYSNIKSGFAEQLSEVTKAIKNDYSGNDFIDSDIVAGNIVDAVRKSKTKSGIKSYLKEYYPDITDTAVDDIVNLVHGIMEMPTGYFEAKPQRAVRFDEVKYAVVPETLDENIKKQLSEYGVQVVEYENGNEEDRTAKLNSLDDVKFSVSEQASAEYEMLKQENNDLKTQIEALKKEMELTSGHTVDAEAVSKLAQRYIREYKSKADVEEVSAKLKQIFEYVASKDANAEEANKAMFELASQIVNKSETLNTEMRDTFKDVLDIIRSARIYVDDATKSEIEALYGDYNTFRKSMFGRMKLTTNKESHGQTVDMLVQELAALAPGQFDTNVSEGECLEQLVSFIEATKPRMENPFGDSVAEAASELAWQIFDDYFDTPEVKTFADKYEAKLQKVINENRIARAELRKAERAKAKAFYDEKLKALRDEKNEAIAKLRKEKNDKYDNDIKDLRDAKDKKLKEVRADRDEKLKALREYYKEQQENKREKAAENELRARITVEYKKLYRDLMTNSKEHHIPEIYKESVANVLASIDLISKISKNKEARKGEMSKAAQKISDQLTKLNEFILQHSMYASKENGINTEELYNFDPDLSSNIEVLKKCFEYYANHIQNGTNAVRDMSRKEMEALYKVLKALRYAVKTADKAFSANIKQRITELAENSIAEMATDKTRNPFNKNKGAEAVGALDTYLNSQMLDVRSYHRGLGDSAMEIYKAFRAGLNTYISHIHEIQDYFAKVRKESGLSEKQFKKLSEKYETYETSHGKITMSKAQLMSLYCLSKREQALEHIFGGGIRPTDLKGVRQARPIRISPDELTSLLKNLNSTEIATAEKLQKFMATACAKWGNEVSMAMYGYAKFGEPHYFPIKSSQTGVDTNDQNSGGETGLYSMLNYGFTKSLVPNANNAIDIDDIFNVVSQHAQEMSSYSAYAGAVADGMRWLNYNNRKTGETIKQSMLQKFGTNCEKYFTELIRDINRNKPTGNYGGELSSLLVSAQKAAAIAGNLSVVIQQPTAIMRACAVLDIDLIAKGIAIAATHSVKSAKEAQAHSEIAWWKSQGFFETNMGKSMDEIITGRSTAKDKAVGLAMKPAGFFDDLTWGAIWEATKLWTKKFHPEAEVGSDEFFSITKEKFDDVVDQTQVVDSVLHRPMILRSKNALVKMDMSFMAEPLKSANLLRNAIIDAKNKKPGATKRLIRVYASCVMANVLAAAAKAIVMAFRDTGDDEWREKWLESFVGDLLSSLNPVSIIPFVKDILTLLDGYDVERMDMSAISGIIKFGQQMVTSAQKGDLDTSLSLQNVYKLTRYLSQLTGIPVYNVLREVDTIVDIFGEPIFRASQTTPDTERYEALYNAVMKNDEAEMQNEYDRLGKTQKEIEQRLKSKIIDDSKGNKMFNEDVDKAAKARISGDVKTAVEIVRNLADTTALSKDFWTACVNARVNKISKAQENRTQLIEAGISKLTVDNMSDTEVNEALKSYEAEADTSTASDLNEDTNTESLYTANDLVKALQDGNESDYNTAYDDMLSAKAVSLIMQAEADNKELTADEAEEKAESSIKSAITKVLKPLMRKLYKTDKKKFNEMRKKIIKKFGYTSKQIAKWLTSEE